VDSGSPGVVRSGGGKAAFGMAVAVLLLGALPARAQGVAFDRASTGTGAGNGLTFAHTVGTGRARYLTVAVALTPAGSTSVSSVAYDGLALSRIGIRAGTSCRAELWGLVAPPSGAHDVTLVSTGNPAGVIAGASSFVGVDQARPVGAFGSHTGTDNAPASAEVSVANAADDLTFDIVCGTSAAAPSPDPGQGQSQRWERTRGTLAAAGSTQLNASAGRANMTWTLNGNGSIEWAIATAPLKPAPPPDAGPDVAPDLAPDVAPDLERDRPEPETAIDLAAPEDLVEVAPPEEAAVAEADAAVDAAPDVAAPDLGRELPPPPADAPEEEDGGRRRDVRLQVGCACQTGGPAGGGAAGLVLLALALALGRRRFSEGRRC
jgi:MYXO-CTERM domain-containing protein